MPFRINFGTKEGKTFHSDIEAPSLEGKELGQKFLGEEISPDFSGYEFLITGASDKAGFPSLDNIDGIALKKVLLSYGKGMKKRSKREGKRKRTNYRPSGLRLRKTVRGKVISTNILQINLSVLNEGAKKLSEIFSDQNLPKEAKA